MTECIRTLILSLFVLFTLGACGGGGGSSQDAPTSGRTPSPSPSPEPEVFSLEVEPTAVNDPLGDFHTNSLNVRGFVTGEEPIGFVEILVLDDLNIFDEDVVAQQSLEANLLSIRLNPKDDLRRGTYEGAMALTFCSSSSCNEILGDSPYLVDYTINYIPERWAFDIQDHSHLISEESDSLFPRQVSLEFVSVEGEVLTPIEVRVDWPQGYTGFTLSQDMIDELQVFDFSEDQFSFRLSNSTLGTYVYEFTIFLDSDSDASELTFSIGHAVVPDEFDGARAQLLASQLDFAVENRFADTPPAQSVRVYRPIGGGPFDRISFNYSDCRWLDIDDGLGIEEPGFTDVAVEIEPFFLEQGSQSCEVDVQYAGESIGTLTVDVVSEN